MPTRLEHGTLRGMTAAPSTDATPTGDAVPRQAIRLGLIGAGSNMRRRHLPGFRQCDEVEIVAVANRTRESAAAFASEFGIPTVCESAQELIDRDNVDAVVIGSYPNTHCEFTLAALAADKHVLCEARMAASLEEARRMRAAAKDRKDLVTQLVPAPQGLALRRRVGELVRDHYIGDLREIVVTAADDQFWDFSQPVHWRQLTTLSGVNTLKLGIMHEIVMPWLPDPERVYASQQLFEPNRPDPEAGEYRDVDVPDWVAALVEFKNGVRGIYRINGVSLFGPGCRIELYGSRGTLVIDLGDEERVLGGRIGDDRLAPLAIEPTEEDGWRVEQDFIAAIRNERKVTRTTFADGVRYMEFTEAVLRSSQSGEAVDFPIDRL